jgi:hypothetical protein
VQVFFFCPDTGSFILLHQYRTTMKNAAYVRYQQQHLRQKLSVLFRFCRHEGIEVLVVSDPHKWILKSEIRNKNDKIKRKNMILGFIPQFESRDYKKNAPENIVSKNRSGKKGRVLPQMSHQIIVTSKRKNIEFVLSHEIGHYLAKKFYNQERLHQNEDFANGIAWCIMNQCLYRFDIDNDCDDYTKKAQTCYTYFFDTVNSGKAP